MILALPLVAAPVVSLAARALRGLAPALRGALAGPVEHDPRALIDLGLRGAGWAPALTDAPDEAPAHGALVTAWT